MEMARYVNGVMDDQVDLLDAHDHTGNSAQKTERDQRDEHGREGRITPGRMAEPAEQAFGIAASPLGGFNGAGDGHAVNHAAEYRQVHGITGIEDLPLGTEARIHQQVVRTGELQE